MRTFLLRSLFFLVLALMMAVIVFLWITRTPAQTTLFEQAKTFMRNEPAPVSTSTDTTGANTIPSFTIPKEGIKLSSLTLNDGQRQALETAGINIETFVITEAMISCGAGKLGDARAAEIFAGDAPSLIEMGKLIPCLSR